MRRIVPRSSSCASITVFGFQRSIVALTSSPMSGTYESRRRLLERGLDEAAAALVVFAVADDECGLAIDGDERGHGVAPKEVVRLIGEDQLVGFTAEEVDVAEPSVADRSDGAVALVQALGGDEGLLDREWEEERRGEQGWGPGVFGALLVHVRRVVLGSATHGGRSLRLGGRAGLRAWLRVRLPCCSQEALAGFVLQGGLATFRAVKTPLRRLRRS